MENESGIDWEERVGKRLTKRAWNALRSAEVSAGIIEPGTDDLLAGLSTPTSSFSSVALSAIEGVVGDKIGDVLSRPRSCPLDVNHLRSSLEYAAELAEDDNKGVVGPEHLLLGIISSEGSSASRLLRGAGIDPEDLRQAVYRMLPGLNPEHETEFEEELGQPFTSITLEDRSSRVYIEIQSEPDCLYHMLEDVIIPALVAKGYPEAREDILAGEYDSES